MRSRVSEEKRIEEIVHNEILRDTKHRRGKKRDAKKISKIIYLIDLNNRANQPPLTRKAIQSLLPDIKVNTLEDNLKLLCEFPSERPFLRCKRQKKANKSSGASPLEYHFDELWSFELHKPDDKAIRVEARMTLAPSESK
jgi:hypothetical protein